MTKSKTLFFIFIFSVALNLFFIGGIMYRVATFPEFGPRPIPPSTSWIVRDLSEERQLELAPMLEQDRDDDRRLRRQLVIAQRHVDDVMEERDFDPEALRIAFSELRESNVRYQEFSHQKMLTLFAQLTPQERAAAKAFKQRRGPRERRGGKRPPQDFDTRTSQRQPSPSQ